ncbi:MAG: hypothetical protein ACR2OV_12285 [Hyphomicrobiaceae bacterium]
MTNAQRIAAGLAVGIIVAAGGPSLAQTESEASVASQASQLILEEAIEDSKTKLADEIDRVPGLTYDDISKISRKIPGRVLIPDPTSKASTTRAISVTGGLVSKKCKHFARGYIARRLAKKDPGLARTAALSRVMKHLHAQPTAYAKIAGSRGLKRSDGAIHDAKCPICGPLNSVEIECHKAAVKKSPIRQLVLFDYDSDVLRGEHHAIIGQIKALLNQDPGLHVALIGRASLPGGPVSNFELSSRRIASVWQGLSEIGIPIDKIVAIPIGEDEPHLDLQLAIDYGLESEFTRVGQKPLNQSVYMVIFRPDGKILSDTFATSRVLRSNAMIEVTVSNADGSEFLQGVTVTAVSDQNMQSTSVNTDANGKGYLRNLEKGIWTVYFERKGFVTGITELNLGEGEKKFNSVTLRTADAKDIISGRRAHPPLIKERDRQIATQSSIISRAAAVAVRTESRTGNPLHLRPSPGDTNIGTSLGAPGSPAEFPTVTTVLKTPSPGTQVDETDKGTLLQPRLKGAAPPTESRVQSGTPEKPKLPAPIVNRESSTAVENARRLAEKLRKRQAARNQRRSVEAERGGVTRNQRQSDQAENGSTTGNMTEAEEILRRAFMAKW